MLTFDDIRAIPLLSLLAEEQWEALEQTSSDIHLAVGEFAVPEGGEPAFYAVLSGKIEVVKMIDGVERRLGWRLPGSIFGEVPLALGTSFPAGYRASEPSRVMRVETPQYYALASSSPDFAKKMGALARERLGGLQGDCGGTAPAPTPHGRAALGFRLRRVAPLPRPQSGHFQWLTLTPRSSASRMAGGPPPKEEQCPAIRSPMAPCSINRRLAKSPSGSACRSARAATEYDTVIIGGGPAGLAAAVYGASEGLRTIVVEREAPGGQAGTSSRIENYLGFPNGVSGDELARRALQQARRLGAEILVTRRSRDRHGGERGGSRRRRTVRAQTIILATGVAWRRLAIEGSTG